MVKNRLKVILTDKGIKQNWLAEQVNLTTPSMSNLINNRHQTNIDIAFKIADILEMDITEIFIYTRD